MIAPLLLAAVTLQVPYVHQHKDTCAAASLAMVMAYLKQDVSQEEIARALVEPELRGIAGSRLAAFAGSRGLEAITYQGDMAQLREYLGKGRPLMVTWRLGSHRYHDVVAVGFDDQQDAVLVHDPAAGPYRKVPAATFEKRWAGAGYWTLLVSRRGP